MSLHRGLALLLVEQIKNIIVQINQEGTPVFLVEQNAKMALSIASYSYIMAVGQVLAPTWLMIRR